MRIIIDLQGSQSISRLHGIGRYSLEFTKALIKESKKNEFFIVLNSAFPDSIEPLRETFKNLVPASQMKIFDTPQPVAARDPKNNQRRKISEKIRENFLASLNPDLIYISSLFEGLIDNVVTSLHQLPEIQRFSTAITLYDLIPLTFPEQYLGNPHARNFYMQKIQFLKKAELLLAISDSAQKETVNMLGIPSSHVINCSGGVDIKFKPIEISTEKNYQISENYKILQPFIFYNGGFDIRKNVNSLIIAYSLLPKELQKSHQLVITGESSEYLKYEVYSLANKLKLEKNKIIVTNYISDEQLISLYNLCSLFVFPSLHEGFGLPVLEAMACGAATIASNTTSMPEIIGCKEALFNPKKPRDIANKISEVLINQNFKNYLKEHGIKQAKKFTWKKSAQNALEAFENIKNEKKEKIFIKKHNKKKLAYISPLPPKKTGIADYSARLLPELTCFYDITVISDQTETNDDWLSSIFFIKDINWFKEHASSFDIILYQIGNSPFHYYMFKLINNYPGVVVLHDFFLGGMFHYADRIISGEEYIFERMLYYSHGYPSLIYQKKHGREASYDKYPCNLTILNQSLGTIVHSQHAVDLVQTWYGPNMTDSIKKISEGHLIKKISEKNKKNSKKKLGFCKKDFLICSFGFIHPNKLNHRLILACKKILLYKNIQLVFIGEKYKGDYDKFILNTIEETKLKKQIHFTGFISSELLETYLSAADIAVQLRTQSRGETSASLLNCLAYGIPTIINSHGIFSEIPNDIVIKLDNNFSDIDLEKSIYKLYQNIALQQEMSERALNYINRYHSPFNTAEQYFDTIEYFIENNKNFKEQQLIKYLAKNELFHSNHENLVATANAISFNRLQTIRPRLLIDISYFINIDKNQLIKLEQYKILLELIYCQPKFRIEPIYYENSKKTYLYANKFISIILGLPEEIFSEDLIVEAQSDDIFIVLAPVSTNINQYNSILDQWKIKGTKLYILICNKIIEPNAYLYTIADGCICLDKEYISYIISYLNLTKIKRNVPLKIETIKIPSNQDITTQLLDIVIQKKWSIEWKEAVSSLSIDKIQLIKREIYIAGKKYLFEGDTRYFGNVGDNFDLNLISIFQAFCNERSHVLDLGANIGLTAVALGSICKHGKVVAIEPVPPTFELLKCNVERAKIHNISLQNFGVGDKKCTVVMKGCTDFLAGAFVAELHNADEKHFSVKVPINPLDEVFDQFNLNYLDFIKMDLEGYEIFALEGAKEILKKFKPVVYLEMNHWCLNVFHRITLPEFRERLLNLFPYIFSIENSYYLDFSSPANFHHIAHENLTKFKYFNLIAGFDKDDMLKKFHTINLENEFI